MMYPYLTSNILLLWFKYRSIEKTSHVHFLFFLLWWGSNLLLLLLFRLFLLGFGLGRSGDCYCVTGGNLNFFNLVAV
jgi:hypothetical protein